MARLVVRAARQGVRIGLAGDALGPARAGDERAFLEADYAQLPARLEGRMRFGNRKADKFSAS